jgi:hypothetical protein
MTEINYTRSNLLVSNPAIETGVSIRDFYHKEDDSEHLVRPGSNAASNAADFMLALAVAASSTPNGLPRSATNRYKLKVLSGMFDFSAIEPASYGPILLTSSHDFIDIVAYDTELSVTHDDLYVAPVRENINFTGPTFYVDDASARQTLFSVDGMSDMHFTGIKFENRFLSYKPVFYRYAGGMQRETVFTNCFFDQPGVSSPITGINRTTSTVTCSGGHGVVTNWCYAYFSGIVGTVELNDRAILVNATSPEDIVLYTADETGITLLDMALYADYISDGTLSFTHYEASVYVFDSSSGPSEPVMRSQFYNCVFTGSFNTARMSSEFYLSPILESCYFIGEGWQQGLRSDASIKNCVFSGVCLNGGGVTVEPGAVVESCRFYTRIMGSGTYFKGLIKNCISYSASMGCWLYGVMEGCEFYNNKHLSSESFNLRSGSRIQSSRLSTDYAIPAAILNEYDATIVDSVLDAGVTAAVGLDMITSGVLYTSGCTFTAAVDPAVTVSPVRPSLLKSTLSALISDLKDIVSGPGVTITDQPNALVISAEMVTTFDSHVQVLRVEDDDAASFTAFLAAMDIAKTLTPGGNARSATNRVAVYVTPGAYDVVGSSVYFGPDYAYIDIIGVGTAQARNWDAIPSSADMLHPSTVFYSSGSPIRFMDNTNTACVDMRVRGVHFHDNSGQSLVHLPATPASGQATVTFENCSFTLSIGTLNISAITNANPCEVTFNTGDERMFDEGEVVEFSGVGGMTQLNGKAFRVHQTDVDTVELIGVDSTDFGVYTTGGTLTASRSYIPSGYTSTYTYFPYIITTDGTGSNANFFDCNFVGGITMSGNPATVAYSGTVKRCTMIGTAFDMANAWGATFEDFRITGRFGPTEYYGVGKGTSFTRVRAWGIYGFGYMSDVSGGVDPLNTGNYTDCEFYGAFMQSGRLLVTTIPFTGKMKNMKAPYLNNNCFILLGDNCEIDGCILEKEGVKALMDLDGSDARVYNCRLRKATTTSDLIEGAANNMEVGYCLLDGGGILGPVNVLVDGKNIEIN